MLAKRFGKLVISSLFQNIGTGNAGVGIEELLAKVTLSFAQIRALSVTPVIIVPAPGATKFLELLDLTFIMRRTATAYANGGALEFRLTNGAGAKVSADIAASVVTTGGAGVESNLVGGVITSLTPVLNAPIVVTNATAPFITGTGTADIWAKYRIWTP